MPLKGGLRGLHKREWAQIQVCKHPGMYLSPMTLFLKPLNYSEPQSPDFPHIPPPLSPNCFLHWVTRRNQNLMPLVAVLITRNRPVFLASAFLDQVTLEGVCFPLRCSLCPLTQASLSSPAYWSSWFLGFPLETYPETTAIKRTWRFDTSWI